MKHHFVMINIVEIDILINEFMEAGNNKNKAYQRIVAYQKSKVFDKHLHSRGTCNGSKPNKCKQFTSSMSFDTNSLCALTISTKIEIVLLSKFGENKMSSCDLCKFVDV